MTWYLSMIKRLSVILIRIEFTFDTNWSCKPFRSMTEWRMSLILNERWTLALFQTRTFFSTDKFYVRLSTMCSNHDVIWIYQEMLTQVICQNRFNGPSLIFSTIKHNSRCMLMLFDDDFIYLWWILFTKGHSTFNWMSSL